MTSIGIGIGKAILALYSLGIGSITTFAVSHTPLLATVVLTEQDVLYQGLNQERGELVQGRG